MCMVVWTTDRPSTSGLYGGAYAEGVLWRLIGITMNRGPVEYRDRRWALLRLDRETAS